MSASLRSRTCAHFSFRVPVRIQHLPTICIGEYDSVQRSLKKKVFSVYTSEKLCISFRYVIVECEDQDTQQRDPKTHEMYLNVMRRFSQALLKVSALFQRFGREAANRSHVADVIFGREKRPPSHAHTSSPLQGDKSVRVMRSLLAAQQTFVDRLVQLMKAVQRESGNRKKKVSGARS